MSGRAALIRIDFEHLIEDLGGVVGELESALDALAAEDLDGLVASQLLDRTAELVRARNRIDAELTRTVRRCEVTQAAEHDRLASMTSWLRGHVRLSAGGGRRLVGNGRAVDQLPQLAAGFAAGAITAEQVAVVTAVAKPENVARAAAQGVELAAVDAVLAEAAATRSHVQLGRVVGHYLARLDPDGPEPDPTEGRSLTLSQHADGSLSLRGELDAVGGEKLCAALESMVQADRPAGRGPADPRPAAGRRPGAGRRHSAGLGHPAGAAHGETARAGHHRPRRPGRPGTTPAAATTGFGAMISAARARWPACDAGLSRIVFGPDRAPTELGRTHRVVPPQLRRAVEVRDRHCVFTGCAAPTHWCDVHHLVHWIDDGETTLDNSALLCERHHTKAHHGFRIERPPDGRWRTWRPDGTEILLTADPIS